MVRHLHTIWAEWTEGNMLRLRWADPEASAPAPVYCVYLDGVLTERTASTEALLGLLVPGGLARVDVLAASELEAYGSDLAALAYARPSGSRVTVAVPRVEILACPDFYAYEIAMSSDGSDPVNVVATLKGANNCTWTSEALEDGTYKFRARERDFVGNASAWGPVATVTVNGAPKAPAAAAAVYNQATRQATVTATKPAGQAADIAGYVLYSNNSPGDGLQAELTDHALAWVAPTAILSFTTYELFEGHWTFEWRARDGAGNESAGTRATLDLVKSAGALVMTTARPSRPRLVEAVAIAGGKARLTVRVTSPAAGQTINVYRDNALDGTAAVASGKREYAYETATLVHGTTYAFFVSVSSGTVESEPSEALSVTVDALAPAGDLNLSVGVTN